MNMGRPVSVLLVGIGGYGGTYVEAMLEEGEGHGCRLVGVVDPAAVRRYDKYARATCLTPNRF